MIIQFRAGSENIMYCWICIISYNNSYINKCQIEQMNLSPCRYFKKRSRRKVIDSHSIFHLDQPQITTIAKNELLYENLSHDRLNTVPGGRKRYFNQSLREFHTTFDSWHGQRIQVSQQSLTLKPDYRQQSKRSNSDVFNYARMTKSANLARSNRKNTDSRLKKQQKLHKTVISFNNRAANMVLKSHTSVTSLKEIKSLTPARKQKSHKSSSQQPKISMIISTQLKNKKSSHQNKQSQETSNNYEDSQFFKKSRGILGSKLKNKRQKKMNWMSWNRNNLNQPRLDAFKISNSPLKKEITKIMNLLQQQSKLKKC